MNSFVFYLYVMFMDNTFIWSGYPATWRGMRALYPHPTGYSILDKFWPTTSWRQYQACGEQWTNWCCVLRYAQFSKCPIKACAQEITNDTQVTTSCFGVNCLLSVESILMMLIEKRQLEYFICFSWSWFFLSVVIVTTSLAWVIVFFIVLKCSVSLLTYALIG
jgi:hypothetical protein